MTDPVERVARAICGAFPGIGNVDAQFSESTSVQQMWMDISRAAIAAMPGEPVGYVSPITLHALSNDANGSGYVVGCAAYDTTIPLYAAPAMPATDAVREALAVRIMSHDLQWLPDGPYLSDDDSMLIADALRSAALSHPSQGGWQPIASAPKDGTRILVVCDGDTRVAAWGKTSHVPMYGFCLADQGAEDFDLVQVDLWQPLPAPPEVQP